MLVRSDLQTGAERGITYLRKDHSPLERGTMQVLTLFTVAVLGVKRISVELKLDISTPASSVGSTVEQKAREQDKGTLTRSA